MSVSAHIKEHRKLGITGNYGGLAIPVRSAADLTSGISVYGDRRTIRYQETSTISIANGSNTLNGVGTTWLAGTNMRVDDLIRFRDDTRYYKIKKILSDTQIILYETYLGVSIVATATDITTYYLDWVTFILMPGEYRLDGVKLYPGLAFSSTDKFGTKISEVAAAPAHPFSNWGENRLNNLLIQPTDSWGSLDGLCLTYDNDNNVDNTTKWAGQISVIDNCVIDTRDLNGQHSGGSSRLPINVGGLSIFSNIHLIGESNPNFTSTADSAAVGADIAPTVANTRVRFHSCDIELKPGKRSSSGLDFWPGGVMLDTVATYDIRHSDIFTLEDYQMNPLLGPVAGIATQSTKAIVANLDHVNINFANTNAGDNCYGISNVSASTFNITQCNIEAAGTNGTAIYQNNAAGVCNIRHTRAKGSTNSLNNAAGTMNAAGSVTTIGATAGVITATET